MVTVKGYIGYVLVNSTNAKEIIEQPQLMDQTKNFTIDLNNFTYESSTLEENTYIEVTGEFSMGYWFEFGTYIKPQIWVEEIKILE